MNITLCCRNKFVEVHALSETVQRSLFMPTRKRLDWLHTIPKALLPTYTSIKLRGFYAAKPWCSPNRNEQGKPAVAQHVKKQRDIMTNQDRARDVDLHAERYEQNKRQRKMWYATRRPPELLCWRRATKHGMEICMRIWYVGFLCFCFSKALRIVPQLHPANIIKHEIKNWTIHQRGTFYPSFVVYILIDLLFRFPRPAKGSILRSFCRFFDEKNTPSSTKLRGDTTKLTCYYTK